MDIDKLLDQMDTYGGEDQDPDYRSLHEQIELLVEVIKAKEAEINNLEKDMSVAVEIAKDTLRSEAEKKLRESLALQVHSELKRELRPRVMEEIKGNILSFLSAEQRHELEQEFRSLIEREADDDAMSRLESVVEERVAAERANMRLKIKECEQLKEQLQDQSTIRRIEEKYKHEIETITLERSNEISVLTAKNAELKRELIDLTEKHENESRAFSVEKGNLEQEIEQYKVEIGKLEHQLEIMSEKPEVESRAVQSSQEVGSSEKVETSATFSTNISVEAAHVETDAEIDVMPFSTRENLPQSESIEKPSNESINAVEILTEPLVSQFSAPIDEHCLYPASTKLNSLRKKVADAFELDKREQLAYKRLPEIMLPGNRLGEMLGSAFEFLFDYYNRCEIAYVHRNKFINEIFLYLNKKKYDICLKIIQKELLELRDIDREKHSIYDMIREREAFKSRGVDVEFDRRLAHNLENKAVIYRGVDYWDVLRAEEIVE